MAYFDAGRVYRYLNRGYADWFGVDTGRPEGVSARRFLGEAVYAHVRPHVMRALAGEPQSFAYDLRTQDGQTRTVRTSLAPVWVAASVRVNLVFTSWWSAIARAYAAPRGIIDPDGTPPKKSGA